MASANAPIGIFDSGIGGMTVAKALTRLLPNENMIYFGDTAHLPYGDKSTAAIRSYCISICNMLMHQNCKLILIACNSASAAAFDLVREFVGSRAIALDVIDPVVAHIREKYPDKTIGLIGTRRTVQSNVYKKKLDLSDCSITLKSLATPLLAPMIEEGFFDNSVSISVVNQYLSHPTLLGIEALILACTHYPLLKSEIEAYYQGTVEVLDTSEIVALAVKKSLEDNNLLNPAGQGSRDFFVSDYTASFEASTKIFFGEKIRLQHYPLWG